MPVADSHMSITDSAYRTVGSSPETSETNAGISNASGGFTSDISTYGTPPAVMYHPPYWNSAESADGVGCPGLRNSFTVALAINISDQLYLSKLLDGDRDGHGSSLLSRYPDNYGD